MKLLSCLAGCLLSVSAYAQYNLTKFDVHSSSGSNPQSFTTFKDKVYFFGNDGIAGNELWWCDGYTYGMVADINPGAAHGIDPFSAGSNNMCVLGNKLYFPARDSVHGTEIWEYDGVNPPKMVMDLDSVLNLRGQLAALNGWLYFKAQTTATSGATRIYRYNPQTHVYFQTGANESSSTNEPLVAFNGKLLYAGFGAGGTELYEYNPLSNTSQVIELNAGPASSSPDGFYVYKNTLFFLAANNATGLELYSYNGFTAPRRLTDIRPGNASSFGLASQNSEKMAVYNGKLYFMAYYQLSSFFRHLYSYDPVLDTVSLVTEMNSSTYALGMAVYGRKLYISTDSNAGQNQGLFMYDGSNVRHFSSTGFNTFTTPGWLTESNGRLYFSDWDFNSPLTAYEPYVFTDPVALDVPEIKKGNATTVYPNPATTEARISFVLKNAAQLNVSLTDMQGRVVYAASQRYEAGINEAVVPVQQLATGVYIYSVANEEGEVLGKGKVLKQ